MGPRMKYVLLIACLLTISHLADGRKSLSPGRKSTSGSGRRRTTPRQSNQDAAKLSYPQQNTHQSNQPSPQIGWNVPKQDAPAVAVNKPPSYSQSNMGPPPPYSAQNIPGAQVNRHEPPPVYTPNVQSGYPHANAPPSYPGNQQSHAVPNYQQPSYQQPSYHQPAYPQQAGGYPQQHNYYPQGAAPIPPGQQPIYQNAAIQPGFYPAGSSPVLTQQKSSSGLGFGTGLLAGGLGGALLGHALTPSRDNHDRVIIINNSDGSQSSSSNPNSVPPVTAAPVSQPNSATVAPMQPGVVPMAPGVVPMAPGGQQQPAESPVPLASFPANSMGPTNQPPTIYGTSCIPVQVNETDPQDPSKMITKDTVVCYNVTQPYYPGANPVPNADGSMPLAPMAQPPYYPVANPVPNADGSVPLAPMPQPNMTGPMSMNMESPVPLAPFPADSLTAPDPARAGVMCVPVQVNNTDTVVCYNITQAPGSNQPELVHDKNTPKPLLGTIAQRSNAARLSMPMSFSFTSILKTITMILCAYSIF